MPEEVPGVASKVSPGDTSFNHPSKGDRGGGGEVSIALHVGRPNQCPAGVQSAEHLVDSDRGDSEPIEEGEEDEALSLRAQYPQILRRPGGPVKVATGAAQPRARDRVVTGRGALRTGARGSGSPVVGSVRPRTERGGGNRLRALLLLLDDRDEPACVCRGGCSESIIGRLSDPRRGSAAMVHPRS